MPIRATAFGVESTAPFVKATSASALPVANMIAKADAPETEPAKPLPARDLARTLEIVKRNPPKRPLPMTTGLDNDARLKQEDELNLRSIQWARANLQM